MKPDQPEISVLISTYDDREYVQKKIGEVLSQSAFERSEFIFLETASPGKERELLEPFCNSYPNCHLIALDKRLTLYEAWNAGWAAAKASIVCISNMDDCMHKDLLRLTIAEMNDRQLDLCSVLIAKQRLTDSQINSWEPSRIKNLELQRRPGSFFAWRRSLIESFGAFDEEFLIAGDKDFWARASHNKLRIGFVPYVLYFYTQHENQLSKTPKHLEQKSAEKLYHESKSYLHEWPREIINEMRKIERKRRSIFPLFNRYILET